MNYKTTLTGLCLALTLHSVATQAGTWQVGILAENSRSPFIGSLSETNGLPMINYIGDRFSYFGGEIEYRLSSQNGADTYIIAQMREQQFYSASLDLDDDLGIDGMSDRDTGIEIGLGFKNQSTWGQLVLEGVIDAANTHEGYELSAKYSYPKQIGRWLFEPGIGVQLQSSDLVDYYHGVRDTEAQFDRPAYTADRSVNTLTSLMVGYSINAQLLAIAGVEQTTLDSSIADSPIVEEKKFRKGYMGLLYTF